MFTLHPLQSGEREAIECAADPRSRGRAWTQSACGG